MKIKVGEYIRTKSGFITKLIEKTDTGYYFFDKPIFGDCEDYIADYYWDSFCKNDILAHSKNIIDLIEVGDYVNGQKVLKTNCNLEYIDDDSETGVYEINNGLELQTGWIYFGYEIKSIVTKKQFKNMEYEV